MDVRRLAALALGAVAAVQLARAVQLAAGKHPDCIRPRIQALVLALSAVVLGLTASMYYLST